MSMMPERFWVRYEVREPPDVGYPEAIIIRIFDGIGYDLYMTHEKTNQETGKKENTLEFLERW